MEKMNSFGVEVPSDTKLVVNGTEIPSPRYELGQEVPFASMRLLVPARITERILKVNIDNPAKMEYLYNLVDTMVKKDPWTWQEVSEERLAEIIRDATYYLSKQGGRYGKFENI
jgi:hypothetical protein